MSAVVAAMARCLDEHCDWGAQGTPNRVDRDAGMHTSETKHATCVWSSPTKED